MRTFAGSLLFFSFLILPGCTRPHLQEGRACYQYASKSPDQQESTFFHTIAAEEFVLAIRYESINGEEEMETRSKLIRSLLEIGLGSLADAEIRITAKKFEDYTYRMSLSDPGVLHLVSAERARLLAALATEDEIRMELLEEAITEAYLAHNRFDSQEVRKHVDLVKVRLLRLQAISMLDFLSPDRLNLTQEVMDTLKQALKLCLKYRNEDFRKQRRRIKGAIFALKTYP
jgi:hypothetical protein